MATLPSSDICNSRTQPEPADVIPFPGSGRQSGAKLEDALSMCVGYLSLAGFVSGLALLVMR
jgi:hypothetical protein